MFYNNLEIVENKIDWNIVKFRKYKLRELTKEHNKNIMAFDTETLMGYCKLIADSNGHYLLNPNIDNIMEYLTKRKYELSHNFFFNMNYDINAIIKMLPSENIMDLKETNKTQFGKYGLFYIPRKIFKIRHGHHTVNYFDVMQFFDGSLEKTAKKYLDMEKYTGSFDKIDGEKLGTSKQYWIDNLDIIIEYCINDCKLTQKLAELLNNTVYDVMGCYPDKYTSQASITEYYIRKNVKLPNINELHEQILQFAFNTYTGGRFEIIEKGNIGECSLFDIKSAYPYYMKSLLDINEGKWKKVYSLNENADYGYYLVKVFTKYNPISPIGYYLPNGILTYPLIECIKYMTKNELLNYEKYIEYEIIEGWEFYADKYVYPFKEYIENIYHHKSITPKTDFKYNLYKILMNSGYGKFYQKYKKPNGYFYTGKLFNPIYATEITSNTQIQIFNYAMMDIDNFVGFATDSVLFKGNPELPIKDELGCWEKEITGKGIVLKSGMYKIDDKLKSRGIRKGKYVKTPFGNYDDIIDYIINQPDLLKYPIIQSNPLTFKRVLQCKNKYQISDINLFTPETLEIDINKDFKRMWMGEFEKGLDLLTKSIKSEPLEMYA